MTKLQSLKIEFPELDYEAGRFYQDADSDTIVSEDANQIIRDHFYDVMNVGKGSLSIEQAMTDEFNLDFTAEYCDNSYHEAFKTV